MEAHETEPETEATSDPTQERSSEDTPAQTDQSSSELGVSGTSVTASSPSDQAGDSSEASSDQEPESSSSESGISESEPRSSDSEPSSEGGDSSAETSSDDRSADEGLLAGTGEELAPGVGGAGEHPAPAAMRDPETGELRVAGQPPAGTAALSEAPAGDTSDVRSGDDVDPEVRERSSTRYTSRSRSTPTAPTSGRSKEDTMGVTAPNPNEPRFPYSGGTDNPGDNTSLPGGPTNVAATETAPLTTSGASLTASVQRNPPLPAGIAQQGSDTVLPAGMQAVPLTAAGFESTSDRGRSPAGAVIFDPGTGEERESGQDETAGETEMTPGMTPAAFPEPNP